jgi:hypothetical protein
MQVARMMTDKSSSNDVQASNAPADAVRVALALGQQVNDVSGDSDFTLRAVLVPVDGENAIVLVAESGQRTMRALQQTPKVNAVINIDTTHELVRKPADKLLVTTVVTRVFGTYGVLTPLAFVIHYGKSGELFRAVLSAVEEVLDFKSLAQTKRVSHS